jgi:hypothetical protein
MKTVIFKIMFALFTITLIVFGCKKPAPVSVGPTLEFIKDIGYISSDTAWAAGDTAIISLKCTWNGNDLVRTIYCYHNDVKQDPPIQIDPALGEDFTYKLKITKSLLYAEKYNFEVLDELGNVNKIGLTITLDDSGGAIEFEQLIIGMQKNPSNGSYFDFTNGRNLDSTTAHSSQGLVDMVGGFEFFAKSFLTSPGSDNTVDVYDFSGWTTHNLTQFCSTTISVAQFNLIKTDKVLISCFHQDEAINIIGVLKPNQIYSFKTYNGRYGLLKIITPAVSEFGQIAFDYKIQVIPPPK